MGGWGVDTNRFDIRIWLTTILELKKKNEIEGASKKKVVDDLLEIESFILSKQMSLVIFSCPFFPDYVLKVMEF